MQIAYIRNGLVTGAAALALSACGGSGGGVIASIPTPPVMSPTPTSTAPLPPEHFALVSAAPFAVVATGDTFTTDAQGQHPALQSQPSAKDVQFSYDAGTKTYQISLPDFQSGTLANISYGGSVGQVATGSISQVTAGSSTALQNVYVDQPVPGSHFSSYTYTSFGSWTGTIGTNNNQVIRGEGIFAYGIPTVAGDVPTIGGATYTADIFASRGLDSIPEVGGSVNLTFNFASGTLSGSMHPQINDDWDGIFVDFGRYDFTQTVYSTGSATFAGKFIVPGLPNADSSFNGNFTGPNAAELMARFQAPYLLNGEQGTIAGVWIGKKN